MKKIIVIFLMFLNVSLFASDNNANDNKLLQGMVDYLKILTLNKKNQVKNTENKKNQVQNTVFQDTNNTDFQDINLVMCHKKILDTRDLTFLCDKQYKLELYLDAMGDSLEINQIKDEYGYTLLDYFIRRQDQKMVSKVLIEHKADPNQQNINGETSLFLSVSVCNENITKLLVRYGADILHTNKNGRTIKDIAQTKCYNNPGFKSWINDEWLAAHTKSLQQKERQNKLDEYVLQLHKDEENLQPSKPFCSIATDFIGPLVEYHRE